MSEKRSFVRFLVTLIAPFVLIVVGAAMVGLGFSQGWSGLTVPGLVIAGAGVLWGGLVLLFNGPLDWLD